MSAPFGLRYAPPRFADFSLATAGIIDSSTKLRPSLRRQPVHPLTGRTSTQSPSTTSSTGYHDAASRNSARPARHSPTRRLIASEVRPALRPLTPESAAGISATVRRPRNRRLPSFRQQVGRKGHTQQASRMPLRFPRRPTSSCRRRTRQRRELTL